MLVGYLYLTQMRVQSYISTLWRTELVLFTHKTSFIFCQYKSTEPKTIQSRWNDWTRIPKRGLSSRRPVQLRSGMTLVRRPSCQGRLPFRFGVRPKVKGENTFCPRQPSLDRGSLDRKTRYWTLAKIGGRRLAEFRWGPGRIHHGRQRQLKGIREPLG